MSVRVQLSIAAIAGGQPAAPEPALMLRGSHISIVLAGINGETVPAVEMWCDRPPPVQLAKPIDMPVAQLVAAGVTSCEQLGRLAFSTAFGVDGTACKLFGSLRSTVKFAQQLSRWLGIDDTLARAGG
jgi:hypothetical protein